MEVANGFHSSQQNILKVSSELDGSKQSLNGFENSIVEIAEKKKRIAIIGGGLSGIGSIVALKAEGFEPVCFEYRDKPGGTWYYSDDPIDEGYASTMSTTVLNNSKELSAFSNFPPRKEHNIYMRHSEAYQYYMDWARHNDCERYIRCNTEVVKVKKSEDYEKSGRFMVTVKDKISGNISSDIYDGVAVCTGHFSLPNNVTFPGQEKYKGRIIHTHSLKTAEGFKGKNVLVIGNGCSGLDAADMISNVAKQVYISSRNGMFAFSRLGPRGYPIDHVLLRRTFEIFRKNLPINFVSWYLETFYLDKKFDHRLYSVQPKHHILSKDPYLNDVIFSKLLSGAVALRGDVKYFTEHGVVFDGDENVTGIDCVILATGYKWEYPFLEEGLLETEINGRINLYKCMYPVQLPHPTLVFISFINVFGPGVPIGEIQTRWAARVLAGKSKLPSREKMLKDVIKQHRRNEKRYTPSDYMTVRIDFIEYLDDIASQFGVKPNLLKYFFTDFPLYLKLFFGPNLPYQYRLEGPDKWEGARKAIMTSNDRLLWPLTRGRKVKKSITHKTAEFICNFFPRNVYL